MTYSDWTRVLETSCNIFFFGGRGGGGGGGGGVGGGGGGGGGGRRLIGRGLRTENMGQEPRVEEHKYPMIKWDYLTLLYEAISWHHQNKHLNNLNNFCLLMYIYIYYIYIYTYIILAKKKKL